jgi:hypothetical protein
MLKVLEIIFLFIVYMVILFIPCLNGQVLENAGILGNSYCYCRS